MKGQWVGYYKGTNQGLILLDVEGDGPFNVFAFVFDDNPGHPSFVSQFSILTNNIRNSVVAPVYPIDPDIAEPTTWAALKSRFEELIAPANATITFEFIGDQLHAVWTTDIQTHGESLLTKSKAAEESEYIGEKYSKTWKEFCELVLSEPSGEFVYRGQESPWRLRTQFHRMGRLNLAKFLNNDVPNAHKTLSFYTKHKFDLKDADEMGSFVHLLQHHGFPTPLLDWSYSPFVAAFFAFRKVSTKASKKVRIYRFNKQKWVSDFPQFTKLTWVRPHLSFLEFMALENPRMLPQQALSSITNIDDIESYIKVAEALRNETYLEVIDIPYQEKSEVLRMTRLMGITAGSLFPGLDGACEELKNKIFGER